MDTRAIPMTRAYLTRNAIKNELTMPPQKMASHIYGNVSLKLSLPKPRLTLGFDIWPLSQTPVRVFSISGGQPPKASGVDIPPPVMAPIPAAYDRPISVKKKPMPTPVAVLMVAGISLTSHCRIPVSARMIKMMPSTKTAVRAVRYEMAPLPLVPTT